MKQGAVLFAQGSHKKVSIAEHATRRSNRKTCAVPYCVRGYAPRLAVRANDGNIRQSKTLKDPFRHPFRPLLPKKCASARSPLRAVSRAMRFRQRTQPCRERMRGCAVDDALGHRSGRISARTRAFFGSCRGNPSQTLATKRNRPRTQREGGPEGPPSLEVRCPLKRVRAISRGAVLRAGRSA